MIRLITADLDGTLLNSQKQLSPNLFPLIEHLRAQGIRFAPASGRQYFNLRRLFAPIADDLLYLCENGAVIYDGNCELFVDEVPREDFLRPLALVRQMPRLHTVYCGLESAYIEDGDDAVFVENVRMYYEKLTIVKDLSQVRDRLFKLAVFCRNTAETDSYPALSKFTDRFQVVLSGSDWVDLMNPQTNKGTALARIMKQQGLSPDECMAFGDYLNDTEMMHAVTYSFAMANAHPDLKAVCRYEAPSNDKDGVVRAIDQFLQLTNP